MTEGELRGLVRVSFAKVAEYQKRGAVHFHAMIRLDAATDCGCPGCVAPPPTGFTVSMRVVGAVGVAGVVAAGACPPVAVPQVLTREVGRPPASPLTMEIRVGTP